MPTASIAPLTVLVIDDDEVMRELLSLVLGMEGHTVLTAEDGDHALAQLSALSPAAPPNVILTDLQMPGLSGAPLAAHLRGACPAPAFLIAMSGSKPSAADTAPFDAFLLKPFTSEHFSAAIETLVGKLVAAPGRAAQAAAAPAAAAAALDETIYNKLTTTMPPTQLKQLYDLCLDDALKRIERMSAAAAAADAATYTREAHAIKGGCGMLGASELYMLATRMETGALVSTPLLNDFTLAAQRLRRILDARS